MPDATERKILVMCTFVATCIALAPQEWVGAGTLFVLSAILFLLHREITSAEEKFVALLEQWAPAAPAQAPASPPTDAAEPEMRESA